MEEREAKITKVNPDLSTEGKDLQTGANVFITNPGSVNVEFGNDAVYLHMQVGRPPHEKEINILKKVKV